MNIIHVIIMGVCKMKDDFVVATLPIKPQEKASVGRVTAPIVAEFVSKKIGCDFTFSVNTLHSYEERSIYLHDYLRSVSEIGVEFDSLYVDSQHTDKYLENIEMLISRGIIVKKTSTVLRCDCGKVDIVKEGIRSHDGALLYTFDQGKYICKHCNGICREYREEGLYFKLDEDINDDIKIFPTFLKKEVMQFSQAMKGSDLLISKYRNTGYVVDNFNVDIDFLWMNYVTDFAQHNQILVACNREIFKMYLLNYINKHMDNKNLMFIAHPFITKPDGMDLKNMMGRYDELYRKLSVLYTIKWRNRQCQYNPNLIQQIAKLGGEKRKILFDDISIMDYLADFDLEDYFEELFYRRINLQSDMAKVKRLGERK